MHKTEKRLLKTLGIDENLISEDYDSWSGALWSYCNDLESYNYALSYAWEMLDEETGEGTTEYEKAVKEYDANLEQLREEVLGYIGELK